MEGQVVKESFLFFVEQKRLRIFLPVSKAKTYSKERLNFYNEEKNSWYMKTPKGAMTIARTTMVRGKMPELQWSNDRCPTTMVLQ